ncbi:hypothetical protein PV327_010367 [Microctonus hyperodae]|uniref:Uncharacterized protein n=1 Tax=Microctonus hyperodae TaxID=165561 RepID=A0AA39KUV2_MICHY|nr:hypothetical protein PV327_010367 [Microctonus hyperodae]
MAETLHNNDDHDNDIGGSIFILILLIVNVNTLRYELQVNSITEVILNYSVEVFKILQNDELPKPKDTMVKLIKIQADNQQIRKIMYDYEKTADEYLSEHLQKQIDALYVNIREICLRNDGKNTKTIDSILRPYQGGYYYELFCEFLLHCNTNTNETLMQKIFHYYQQIRSIDTSDELKAWDQYVISFYNSVLLTITKMYSIILISYKYAAYPTEEGIAFSFIADNLRDSTSYKTVKNNAVMEFKKLVKILTSSINPIIVEPTEIYQNDPSHYIEDINYGQLTYFLRSYETNQKYLNPNHDCDFNCIDYSNTHHYTVKKNEVANRESICNGHIYSCKKILPKKICVNNETCDIDALSSPVDIQRGCSICACTCDENKSQQSIRYVNLRSVMSFHIKGYIVTGIRFVIINRTISLQIQQGVYNNITVDPTTVRWKKINDINPNDADESEIVKLNYNRRSFALDDVLLPIDSVVIGVKFILERGLIKLRIMGSNRKNFGGLDTFQRKTLVSCDMRINRDEINTKGLTIPTLKKFNNRIFSEQNKFSTIFKQAKMTNSTKEYIVPFIDLQDVVTNPPSPIVGAGLHLRYDIGSGGFLAPKIMSHHDSRVTSAHYINNILNSI